MLGLGTGAPIVQVYHERSIILPDVSRVLACLYEKDIKFETHTASYKSLLRLQASSHAPVPFYDGPTFLEESREICRYIAEKYEHHGYPFLFGKDALERASVEQWLHNEEHAFNPPSRALFCHLAFPLDEDDGDDIDMYAKKLEEVLEVYEQRLGDSEFLAGNKFTLADLVHLPNSHYIKASNKFLYLYDSRKNVRRWWDAISSRDSWKKVLMDMKRVEEQEELRKQQQQQKEHPRISGHPIRIDSQKKTSAEPRTILVPHADTVLSSPRFPQTEEPFPIDTFPNEAHASSSQNTPIADVTSAVFTTPPETPSASVRSTPVTSKKYPIPVQSTEGTTSPATAKKPPITDAAKSITKDALILEPPETDLSTRHAPTSSVDVSNNLDVSDYYPSNTDEETPYIEPTPRRTSETLNTFDGSKIATGHAKTRSISAKKDSDKPSPSDFYKSDRRATGVDSQYKESVPYSGHTSPKPEPTDTSASKLHTWSRSRDVAFKPKEMIGQDDQDTFKETESDDRSLLRDQRSDTWQAASTLPEQEVNQDGRSVAPPSQTRYPSSTPPSKTRYQIAKDASKQPRGTAPTPEKKAAQDDNETSEESKIADEAASTEQPLHAWRAPISPRRQEAEDSSRKNTSFQKRYPDDDEDMQVANTASGSRQISPDGGKGIFEDTKLADSTTRSAKPLYTDRSALPLTRQAEVEDAHDKGRRSRVTIPESQKMVARDSQDTNGERRKTAIPREQPSHSLQAIPQSRPAAAKDVPSATGETIEFPDTLDTRNKSRVTFEETKDPDSEPRAQFLGAQDAQRTNGESRTPTSDQRKEVSRQLKPDTQDPFQQSKLPAIDQKGLGSSSLKERDARDDQSTSEEKSISTERHREMIKSESRGSIKVEGTSSIKPPVAQDNQGQAQIMEADKKTNGSTPKHQQDSDVLYTLDGKLDTTAPANAKTRYDYGAEEPSYRKDTTYDQKSLPPLPRKEPTSKVQPTYESLQEAAPHGGLSTQPSTIEQWQRASVPLNDVTSSSAVEEIDMSTTDHKLTPMSQQATPSSVGVNQMPKESGEQRVEQPVPIESETSGVQSASTSFPGASTAHHGTTDHKFAKQSIIDGRVGEPTKIQASTPDSASAHTKRAIPNDHEIGGPELVSTPDGQISEAAKTRHDQATLHKDVHGANLPTHDVAKDIFKEATVADYAPSRSKLIYTQRPTPVPRHREGEDTMDIDRGIKSRETVPDRQKMVERRAGRAVAPVSDRLKAVPPSKQAAAEDALGATSDTVQSPDILDTSKKSRGTYEAAKAPGSTLSKAHSLGAQDVQHTTGESTTPTAGQRKDVSTKPQPDVQDGLKESKLSTTNWNGLGSLSSERNDAIETETNIAGEKSFSTDRLRETSKKSEPIIPKEHPVDSQGSVKEEKTSSTYQKKPLVARDSHEQAQTISSVGEKANGSTRKHQQASGAPNTSNKELNASEPARAKTNDDFNAEEPYIGDTIDDRKVAPPLLYRELTSQVQPPSEPSHDAAPRGDLSGKPSTIDQWQRTSAPLHGMTTSSGDDEVATSTIDQKPTPTRKKKIGEKRAETSGAERASPSFPGASVDEHATIGHKYAEQSIIDERVGKPIQMQKSSADAHPASEPTKRGTPEGHKIGDLELVSTPDGQISEQTKAREDPDTVHEDVYDVNLSAHDEKKVADLAPSSAKPMYTEQPALPQSSRTRVEEARDKRMQSRETIPEPQKVVERKKGISGQQPSDRQKAIHPSVEDAPTGGRIQPPYSPDSSKKSRGTFEEAIGLGSTLPKAQALDAQDSQLTKGESTIPTADQRKDWKDAKDDGTIMTEEKSFSTERLKEMFQGSESTTPKTQPTGSQGYSMVDKTSSVYQKGPVAAQESQEEAQIIQAGEKVDSSTPEHQESSGAPYTYNEKLSDSAPARPDIHDDHSAEEPYEKYTTDDKKVAPYLRSREPASRVQPLSEPLQRAVPDGDLPSKSSTIESIDQWRHASAPLHGVSTDSADAEVGMASNNDQKSIPASQEATLSSPVPIGAETYDVGRTVPSLPEASRADNGTIDDKFAEQSNIDERVGAPKQMQEPITAAHTASASMKRTIPDGHEAVDLKLVRTPEGQRLEAAKATQDAATIHDVHDAAIDEKTATYHGNGDELVTEHIHDRQARTPTSTQAQPTVEAPYDSDSSQYVHTGDSAKTKLAKPHVTHQEATAHIAGPTSMDPQRAGTLPTEVAHSQQKSSPSGKGSARAEQPLSHVEPIKADSNVSAADYTNGRQMIFRQQARPSVPRTIGLPASDTQAVIGKIQEGLPDNISTDDSGKPSVPSEEQVSPALQAIPDQEEMTSPPGTTVSPTSDTQLASAEVQEVIPHEQQAVESITPLLSSGKQSSHVRSDFGPGEVGPAEKKFALSDQELLHEQSTSSRPRKEQTVVPTAEQIKKQPTIIGQQDTPDIREALTSEDARDTTPTDAEQIKEQTTIIGQQDTQDTREALTSEDALDTTPTHGDVQPTGSIEPGRRSLSVQGEESTSATQAPPTHVAKDSIDTEDISTDAWGNVQSLKPSTTPNARGIRSGSTPDDVVVAEQKSSPSGQDSADSAEPAFSLGPRNKAIRDSTPSALVLSSTDPSKEDAIVARPGQAKDSQTTPSRQDILSTQRPLGKVQENIPGDDLGEDKPLRPSSAVREGKPSKEVPASAPGIQLGSVPNKVALDEQKFALSDQDSAYPAQPPPSAEPRSKGIGDLAHSTQLNSTTGMRNGDDIVAAPDQAKDSQTTPGQQVKLSAPSSYTQHPSGTLQEDEPADNSGEVKSSEPPSVVREGKPVAAVPVSSLDRGQGSAHTTMPAVLGAQYGTELHKADVDEQKIASSGQDSVRSVQPSFSTEPTKEDAVATATDQTSTLEKIIDQSDTKPAPGKAKTPFSGTLDASKETQKSTLDAHSDVVYKDTTLGSNQAETSNARPDSTPTGRDARLSSGDVPAASYFPETQNLQDSAYAQNIPSDSSGKNESPGHLSTDQAMAPRMSPSVPSVAPLGTNSVQPPRQASIASTVDLGSFPDTQRGIPQGEATPAEQKFPVSDQEPPHTLEPPSSAEPRKEEANAGAGDQPNVPHGQETTVRHQVKAPSPDAREALRKDHEPSHAVLPEQKHDRRTPEVGSTVVDKETTHLSRQAQTSATEPGSTPISGDVPPTSSLQIQNQDTQPPVTTQAPSTQSLQGFAPTQDDFLRKFESPRQTSTDQVIAPVMSPAAPSDAPQGQDSAQSIKTPFSTEPTEDKTVVRAPDQTKDMDTITHQQATASAPDTAKTPFPGTDQEEIPSIAGPTSMDPQLASTLPAELAHSQQKPAPSEKGSARAAQPLSPVEPIKADNDGSAADYTNASQMIFRQRARPSIPSTIGIPGSDTQAVIGKIQEGNPDNISTDDSGKPSIPSQEQVSPALQAIPDQEEMTSPPGTTVSPTSDTQLASAEVQEVIPHEQPAVESTTLFSSGKQGSHVGSAFGPGEVGPVEKKFAPSDQELPHSAEQSTSSRPKKEQTVVPTAEQIKEQTTIIGQQDTQDRREALRSEDALDTTPTHADVQPTGSVEPDRRPLSVQGEESTSATQAPPPRVANDSLDTEDISTDALGNVQSLEPSTTPAVRGILPRSTPDDVAVAEQKSSLSGQDSADPAEAAFSLGPRDKEIKESTPSALVISSTDPSKGDAIVAGPDEAKDSETTPSRQDLLSTQHPSGKVRENIPGDDSGKDKPLRAFSIVREGQDSAYPAQPPSSAEPRSKAIGDLASSTQLNSTTGTRNGDGIFAAPDQAKDSSAEPRKEEVNAAHDQPNVPQGPETTVPHQVKSPSPDARESLQKDQQLSRDDDHISNSANPRVVSEEKASHAGHASEGPTSEVSGAVVDKKMTFPSSQAQTSSTGPESTPISGDSRLSSTDVLATSSLQNEEVQAPAATQVPTRAPIDSASTQNVPAGSLGEITSAAVSDAPQGTEPDEVSAQFSEPPFSAEPSNEASHAGRASESHEGTTRQVHSPAVDAKTTLPIRQVQTANTGPDSTPISGDIPDRSSLQNQEAQPSAATQGPTVQAQNSASTKNEPADSLGDIKSQRQLPTVEVVTPITSFTAPSDSSQGTDPDTNSVQPSEEASFDFSGDEKSTTTQGDQAKTLPNGDLPASQVVGQSESADSQGMDSQNNLEEALTDDNPKIRQQIELFDTQSSIDNKKEADRTGSNLSTTFEDLQKQPSRPKGSMELSDELENQQHSLEENVNQAEQSKAHDTLTGGPEDMEASENTNQKNNKISQVETFDHSRKETSAVQQLGENTKDAPNSTEDVPGDVQAISRSKESSRSSEESMVQLQSEDKISETEAPSSETRQPRGDLPKNSYQNNSSQSQAEASDKSVEQSYPGIQNKDTDSGRLDDSTDSTKPGDMEDESR